MIAPFLNKEDVKGIALATRPDCLNEEIVQYLSTINKQKDVYIELGLQTIHEQTSKLINRGHTFQEFLDGLALCRKYNLEVCVHIINGLPFETKEMRYLGGILGLMIGYICKYYLDKRYVFKTV